jgi:tetratricopeptide (TPR) repeat protein
MKGAQFVNTLLYILGIYNEEEYVLNVFSRTEDVVRIMGCSPSSLYILSDDESEENEQGKIIKEIMEGYKKNCRIAMNYLNVANKTSYAKKEKKEKLPIALSLDLLAGKFIDSEIEEIMKKYSLSAGDLNAIGIGYKDKGQYGTAEKYFIDAIKIDGECGDYVGNLISLYCALEDYDMALRIFQIGIEESKTSLDFIYFHGSRTLFLMENYYGAMEIALHGIENEKCDPYDNLYIIYLKSAWAFLKTGIENMGEDEYVRVFNVASNVASKAIVLFPDSDEIKNLHDSFAKIINKINGQRSRNRK